MNPGSALTIVPLISQLRDYRMPWLTRDLAAGLSVAAVSLPSAIAYPAIVGLPTQTGLFAAIFSMIGYALLGPSRKLMVGPDTATCIMVAGVLTSLGAATETDRVNLTLVLTIAVGVFCFAAAALRLGFLANFLSRPILVGFLAGISISLVIGQIERLTRVAVDTQGLVRPIVDYVGRIGETHLPTLIVGLGTLAFLRIMRRRAPHLPAPLLALIFGIAISAGLDLRSWGVAVLGALPKIDFDLAAPSLEAMRSLANVDLLGGALAIMLVGFGSGIVTTRSFAMKSHSDVDADRELSGFGAANIFSALFGGFPVTASDSRTAVNFAVGGKTQIAALVSSAALAAAVLLLAQSLAYLPTATLGAILVSAAIDLIDLGEFRALRRLGAAESFFAVLTALGVVVAGALQGVFIAIAATLVYLMWYAAHPRLALLGRIPGTIGLYKLHRYPEARAIPGLTLVTLQSGLVFFNADFVKKRLLKIANARRMPDGWFVLDAAGLNVLDSTGVGKLDEIREQLAAMGFRFGLADLNSKARRMIDRAGLREKLGDDMIFPSAEAAAATIEALSAGRSDGTDTAPETRAAHEQKQ